MSTTIIAEVTDAVGGLLQDELAPLRSDRTLRTADAMHAAHARLAELGFLESGRSSEEGLGLRSDAALLTRIAEEWGSLAWSVLPALLANRLDSVLRDRIGEGRLGLVFPCAAAWRDAEIRFDETSGSTTIAGALRHVLLGDAGSAILALPPESSALHGQVLILTAADDSVIGAESYDGFREAAHGRLPIDFTVAPGLADASSHPSALTTLRVLMAAVSTGIARGALATGVRYAQHRIQFGRPIGAYGEIRAMIAHAAAQCRLMNAAVDTTAAAIDSGAEGAVEAAMTLVSCIELSALVTERMQHVHGGWGQMAEFDIGRYVRDGHMVAAFDASLPELDDLISDGLGLPR